MCDRKPCHIAVGELDLARMEAGANRQVLSPVMRCRYGLKCPKNWPPSLAS